MSEEINNPQDALQNGGAAMPDNGNGVQENNGDEIASLIDRILDQRLGRGEYEGKGHLQKVQNEISALEGLLESVKTLKARVDNPSAEFMKELNKDQDAVGNFKKISCNEVINQLTCALDKLRKLESRFRRESVRIAFIGYERQGKSTFLQSLTGLPNEIIPAYDGDSCTGAVSVIHNQKMENDGDYKVFVEFYSLSEFLKNISDKLNKLIPGKNFNLKSIDELKDIDYSNITGDARIELEKLIKERLLGHRDFYEKLLGTGIKDYTNKDKDVIMRFVAQYRDYAKKEDIPSDAAEKDYELRIKEYEADGKTPKVVVWRHHYYWFLAVKSVNIYCEFKNKKCGKIEFVDTVGLIPEKEADEIEKEMFKVLKEDCDGAIDVFRPTSDAGTSFGNEAAIMRKLMIQLAERTPELWLTYAINTIRFGENSNVKNMADIVRKLEAQKTAKEFPYSEYVNVDASNPTEVNDKLLVPHLTLIAQNLSTLDNKLIYDLIKPGGCVKLAYDSCLDLWKQANNVVPLSSTTTWDFDDINDGYPALQDDFNKAMNLLDHDGYAARRNKPCVELQEAYDKLLDEVDIDLPSEIVLTDIFLKSNFATCVQVFETEIEEMRSGLFTLYENVNSNVLIPLQEKVKEDIISILYYNGKLNKLSLPAGCSTDKPSKQWLEDLIVNYIPEDKYKQLYEALRFILDYKINLEGSIENKVIRSLSIIEKGQEEFKEYDGVSPDPHSFEEKAKEVRKVLVRRIPMIQEALSSWTSDFVLEPSLQLYARVHKFHVKIANEAGQRELHRFYKENMGEIWHDEIESKAAISKTFDEWKSSVESLRKALGTKTNKND